MRKVFMLFSFVLISALAFQAFAQERTVTGVIISSEDGNPLPGATVLVKGTTVGTSTDIDGRYSISVPARATLVFSFIGMESREMVVGNRTSIDVTLSLDLVTISEVLVTGYGTQRKADASGSVSVVKAEELEDIPMPSIDKMLQGKAAGVQVSGGSGSPGGSVTIRVRGTGSINAGNSPLFIIDGVQVQTGGLNQMITESNSLAGLNPDDIESINVLKDASAAAIYGAQAANGVVIITTKRGMVGKTEFDFSASTGYNQLLKKLDVMNGPQYAELTLTAYKNRYGETGANYLNRLDTHVNTYGWGADGFSEAPSYDWQDGVFQNGQVQEYRLSARGGDEKTKFYVSGSYSYQEGSVIRTDLDRMTFRTNIDHKANDWLSFETNLSWSNFKQNTVPAGGRYSNPYRTAWLIIPTNQPKDDEGNWIPSLDPSFIGSYRWNVIYEFTEDLMWLKGVQNKIIGNQAFNITPIDNVTIRSNWGIDFNDLVEDLWQDPRSGDGSSDDGYIQKGQNRRVNWQTSNTITYDNIFSDAHHIVALGGFEYRQHTRNDLNAGAYGVPNYKFNIMNAAANPDFTSAQYTQWKLASFFASANYTFNEKYIAKVTMRYDGSSRFGAENRYGFFPSGSVAWRFGAEPFMDGISFLSDAKLRASYGITGNQSIGDFEARGLFTGGSEYLGQAGMTPFSLPNELLTWEESAMADIGIELNFFRNRIVFEADWYNRTSSLLLLDRPLPRSTGWGSITQNIGVVANRGLEMLLSTVNVSTPSLAWRTNFNITFQENEILELIDKVDEDGDPYRIDNRTQVGRAIGDRRLPIWAGVNPADGRPMFYDKDYNISYSTSADDDRHWMGPLEPKFFGNLNNSVTFKGLTLSFDFQWAGGHYRYDSEKSFGDRSGNTADRNQHVYVYERYWRDPGDITDVARPVFGNSYGGATRSYTYSSRNFIKADYFRLKYLTLSYSLPSSLIQRIKLDKVEIFGQATNLWTYAPNWQGYDPEFAGSNFGDYPQLKTMTFGLNMSF